MNDIVQSDSTIKKSDVAGRNTDASMTQSNRPSDDLPKLEAQVRELVDEAKLKYVKDVLRTEDGLYCISFTYEGQHKAHLDICAGLLSAKTPLKVVKVNGSSITVRHEPSYPAFTLGQKVQRKSDGVVITITTLKDNCISGKSEPDEDGEIVEVEMTHRKHFTAVEEVKLDITNFGGDAITETAKTALLGNFLADEPKPVEDVAEAVAAAVTEAAPALKSDIDGANGVGAAIPKPSSEQLQEALEAALTIGDPDDIEALDDAAPEPFADDDEYPPDALDFPTLTPEERLALSGHAPDPKPSDEPPVDPDDTQPLDPAALLEQIAALKKQLEDRDLALQIAQKHIDALNDDLADERAINQARRELPMPEAAKPHIETKALIHRFGEAAEADARFWAEFSDLRNDGWYVAFENMIPLIGSRDKFTYVARLEKLVKTKSPSDQLADAMNAALERVELKPVDAFDALPEGTAAYSLSEVTK